jgi:hypothetical protein
MRITELTSPKIGQSKIVETDPCIQAVKFSETSLDSRLTPLGILTWQPNRWDLFRGHHKRLRHLRMHKGTQEKLASSF